MDEFYNLEHINKKREIIEMFIATVALIVAFANLYGIFYKFNLEIFLVITLAVITGFLTHEMAHRQVARKLGYVAYFRAWYEGLLIAIIVSFLGFIIAAPGAVVIGSLLIDRKDEMKIAAAGPISNIIFSAIFLFLSLFYPLLIYVSKINAFLALFNLIPLKLGDISLDGYKIFMVSIPVWISLFGISIILLLA